MTTHEIESAVEIVKKVYPYALSYKGVKEDEALQTLLSVAQLFVEVKGMPEKKICQFHKENIKEDDCDYCFYNRIFNSVIDECTAHLIKKCEGIEDVINKCNSDEFNGMVTTKDLAQAIKYYLLKGEKKCIS